MILVGDCRARLAELEPESVDAIVTDPPYELNFMNRGWDNSGIAYDIEVWRQALRVLKPGGHLLAFSGSRTYHRMVCAIEDAGFEIRDQIMWLYGSGFPKSHDVSKAIDREAGAVRAVTGIIKLSGYGKANVIHGSQNRNVTDFPKMSDEPATPEAARWQGWGTALKPAHEPIVVARKPLRGTVAANVLAQGTGAINVDGCRVGTDGDTLGRWPANVIHDGSAEVVGVFPDAGGGNGKPIHAGAFGKSGIYGPAKGATSASYADSGSAARFFYTAKASKADRDEGLEGFGPEPSGRANIHPTVKPTSLMRYLCRLVTPPGGTVLDPFTGSGSTGKAAVLEGFRFIGIELSPQYAEIARARIAAAAPGLEDDEPEAEQVQRPEVPGQLRLFA